MQNFRLRLLTLTTLLALVAFPLAARAAACCVAPRAACCPAGTPCDSASGPSCEPEVASFAPGADAREVAAATEAEALAPRPLLEGILLEARTPPKIPHEPPRPRSSLLESGACLHTTLLPPPFRPH